jgi:FeS assembly SUF system protein
MSEQKKAAASEFLKSEEVKATTTSIVDKEALKAQVINALQGVYDPEIPVNIYDLGLIYGVNVSDSGIVLIDLTLTTPGCPVAQTFPGMVRDAVIQVEGVTDADVELVWDPPWNQDMMSEAAKLELGLF